MNIEASTGAAASSPPISAPWIPESFPVDDLNGIKAVYEALSTLPSLSSGSLLNVSDTTLDVQAVTTQRDHLSKAKRKSSIAYAVSLDGQKVAGARRVGFPTEMSPQIVASMPGPNGLLVTLRIVNEKEKKRRFVETSNDAGVLERIEVTETHGDFYADEFFGGIGWSADGRKIAYVAEGNLPTNGVPSFLYQQGWGERYSDKKGRPTLVVVDLDKKKATALDLGTISPGQPRFIDGDAVLLFHALKEDPMKHGSIYCFNRLGGLFTCALDGSNLVKITSEEGARCPRVTADGKGLFYLTNPVTNGTHNSCAKLVKVGSRRVEMLICIKPV